MCLMQELMPVKGAIGGGDGVWTFVLLRSEEDRPLGWTPGTDGRIMRWIVWQWCAKLCWIRLSQDRVLNFGFRGNLLAG